MSFIEIEAIERTINSGLRDTLTARQKQNNCHCHVTRFVVDTLTYIESGDRNACVESRGNLHDVESHSWWLNL